MTWSCPKCSRARLQRYADLLEAGDILWVHCPDCDLEHRMLVDEDRTLISFGGSRVPLIYGREDFSWRK